MAIVEQPEANRYRTEAPAAPPSPYLRAYRHLLPARIRRRLRDRMAPETWERLKAGVEQPALLVRRIRHTVDSGRLHRGGQLVAPLHRPVAVDGRTRIALIRDDLDPLSAREWNLQSVCSALRSAHVEHFAVRGLSDSPSVIGVSADDRGAALAALRRMAVRSRGYVAPAGAAARRAARLGDRPQVWQRAAREPVFRVFCYQSDRRSGEVYGAEYGCDIELWEPDGDRLLAPRRNRCCDSVERRASAGVIVPGRVFTRLAPAHTPEYETVPTAAGASTDAVPAPTPAPGPAVGPAPAAAPAPASTPAAPAATGARPAADPAPGHGTDHAPDREPAPEPAPEPPRNPAPGPLAGPADSPAPRPSPAGGAPVRTPACAARPPLLPVRSRAEFVAPLPDDIRFPVDAVYTWVDGTDPDWQERRAKAAGTVCRPYHAESANDARFIGHDELRYSLRSLHRYAPWIRRIYLVTDRQLPEWLNTAEPRLTVVDHRELFTDPGLLPTFNSHAIESQLHHIEGLSEHFLYFNDDVFLGRPLVPQRFFLGNGTTRFFPSKAQLPCGPPDETDTPVSAAGKNNRLLLAGRFGSSIVQKMKHTPCALRRSVLYEIEREFPEEHRRTAASRFRSLGDLAIANSLHHYYAFHTGRAVPGSIRYDYVDTASPDLARRLHRILAARSCHTFCINDTVSCDEEAGRLVRRFLESYFPSPSPFETAEARAYAAGDPLNRPQMPGGWDGTSGQEPLEPEEPCESAESAAPEAEPADPGAPADRAGRRGESRARRGYRVSRSVTA